jgi:hypothetical protein
VHGLNDAWPEHVSGFEGEAHESIFGLALDSRPHDSSLFRAVGSGAGNVNERHARVQARQSLPNRDGDIVSDALVLRLGHSGRGHSQTEEARVEAAQVTLDIVIVQQIRADDFPQLRVSHSGSRASDGLNNLYVWVKQAFPEDALADHARRSEELNVHHRVTTADLRREPTGWQDRASGCDWRAPGSKGSCALQPLCRCGDFLRPAEVSSRPLPADGIAQGL